MGKVKIIEAVKVKKSFATGKTITEVIKGVDFTIESGEYVVFFGPSGCGKSTLLNLCSGLESPTEGKLLVRGENVSSYNSDQLAEFRQTKIGIVFQQFNLLKSLTCQENVGLPLIAAGEPRARAMNRASNLLNTFGLSKHLTKIPTELSGGQQQRVAMARAMSANPWVLICDEPTGNLDSKSSKEVMEILYYLNVKSKRTIVMVTHNSEHLNYANKVFHVRDGAIIKTQINHKRPPLEKTGDFDLKSHALDQS
jgi:putative ABC transport system ATP-binding protein